MGAGASRGTTSKDDLTDRVVNIVLSDGIEGVTVRRVAAAAGVSIGAVQHHFPTRASLLAGAMDRVSDLFAAGVDGLRLDELPPADALLAVALLLGAVEPDDRGPAAVWLTFVTKAATDPEIAAKHAREWAEVENALVGLIAAARGSSDSPSVRDEAVRDQAVRDEAALLLAALDGVAVARVSEPGRMTPERAQTLVREAVARALRA